MARVEFGPYGIQSDHYDDDTPNVTIESWYKNVGDKVEADEAIFAFTTDKVSGDIVSRISGVIVEIDERYKEPGSVWESGPVGIIETDPDAVVTKQETASAQSEPEAGVDEDAEEVQIGKEPRPNVFVSTPARKMAEEAGVNIADVVAYFPDARRIEKINVQEFLKDRAQIAENPADSSEISQAVPMAQSQLHEAGISRENVKGTGPGGIIIVSDAQTAIASMNMEGKPKIVEEREEVSPVPDNVILLKPSREWLTVAHNLEKGSKSVIAGGEPLDTKFEEYDLNPLLRFKDEDEYLFKQAFGVRLRLWTPVAMAVVNTLKKRDFWIFNGYWHVEDESDRNKDMVALYKEVNLGMSYDRGVRADIDLEKGTISGQRLRLLTQHKADKIGIMPFYTRIDELLNNADHDSQNGGKLSKTAMSDWTGWTFIFNNVGAARHARGNSLFTPSMSAMFNMGVIRRDGRVNFQIFFDHRMIDGVISTYFVDAVYEELVKEVLPALRRICYQK